MDTVKIPERGRSLSFVSPKSVRSRSLSPTTVRAKNDCFVSCFKALCSLLGVEINESDKKLLKLQEHYFTNYAARSSLDRRHPKIYKKKFLPSEFLTKLGLFETISPFIPLKILITESDESTDLNTQMNFDKFLVKIFTPGSLMICLSDEKNYAHVILIDIKLRNPDLGSIEGNFQWRILDTNLDANIRSGYFDESPFSRDGKYLTANSKKDFLFALLMIIVANNKALPNSEYLNFQTIEYSSRSFG